MQYSSVAFIVLDLAPSWRRGRDPKVSLPEISDVCTRNKDNNHSPPPLRSRSEPDLLLLGIQLTTAAARVGNPLQILQKRCCKKPEPPKGSSYVNQA